MIPKTLPRTEQTKPWTQYNDEEIRTTIDARMAEIVRDAQIDPASPADLGAVAQILGNMLVDATEGPNHCAELHGHILRLITVQMAIRIREVKLK